MSYAFQTFFAPVGPKRKNLPALREAYEKKYGPVQIDDGRAWAAIGPEDLFDIAPFDLAAESRQFGEAIGLRVSTYGDDCLVYDHWVNGENLRALTYEPNDGWIRVAGEPEPWEEDAFFREGDLEEDLDLLASAYSREDNTALIAELNQLMEARRLIQGFMYPIVAGDVVLARIIDHFNLTRPRLD